MHVLDERLVLQIFDTKPLRLQRLNTRMKEINLAVRKRRRKEIHCCLQREEFEKQNPLRHYWIGKKKRNITVDTKKENLVELTGLKRAKMKRRFQIDLPGWFVLFFY